MKTSIVETSTISAGFGNTPGDVYSTSPFAANNAGAGALAKSQLYRTYTTLYEEVKILGVKISIAVVTPVGDTTTPSLQIYTAWDRKHGYGEPAATAADIISSSTYNVATALNNNVAKLSRYLFASDLMEKAIWIDASTNAQYANTAWMAAGVNCPCFCPSFLFTCLSPSLGAAHNITISVSYTYYLAFRNPKFGGSNSGSKVENLGPRSVFPDGAGDMDGDGGDMVEHEDLDADSPPDMIDDEDPPAAAEPAAAPAKRSSAVVVQSPAKKSHLNN